MRLLMIAALLAGCERTSTLYCTNHPGTCDSPTIDAAAPACTADQQCQDNANGKPYCLDMTECIACRTSDDCAEPTATCDTGTHACRGCTTNAECLSSVCLETGACAALDQVAYVGGTVESTTCTMAMPCNSISDVQVLSPKRRYIRMVADITETGTITFRNSELYTILGTGHVIHTTGQGFRIGDQADIAFQNVEITPATTDTNPSNDCIFVDTGTPMVRVSHANIHHCGGDPLDVYAGTVLVDTSVLHDSVFGIEIFNDAVVGVSHTVIHHNSRSGIAVNTGSGTTTLDAAVIAFNGGGNLDTPGLDISGNAIVTNTIIARNGSTSATVGGVRVTAGASRFDFCTISDNVTIGIPARGMSCASGVVGETRDSIVTGNTPSIIQGCLPTFTLLDGTSATTSNKMGPPNFITGITDPNDPHFYRLQSTSPAIDAADPASIVVKDIDGESRPAGHADMGADEYHP